MVYGNKRKEFLEVLHQSEQVRCVLGKKNPARAGLKRGSK